MSSHRHGMPRGWLSVSRLADRFSAAGPDGGLGACGAAALDEKGAEVSVA